MEDWEIKPPSPDPRVCTVGVPNTLEALSPMYWRRQEGMEDWDQEQLEAAIASKHGNERPSNATEIICKFFLDAVERRMYGWCALPLRGYRVCTLSPVPGSDGRLAALPPAEVARPPPLPPPPLSPQLTRVQFVPRAVWRPG